MVTHESIELGMSTGAPAVYSGTQVQMLSRSPVLPRLDIGCDWNLKKHSFSRNRQGLPVPVNQTSVRSVLFVVEARRAYQITVSVGRFAQEGPCRHRMSAIKQVVEQHAAASPSEPLSRTWKVVSYCRGPITL